MSTIERTLKEKSMWVASLARRSAVPLLIFAAVFLGYYVLQGYLNGLPDGRISHTAPPDWYKHHVFLADAILHGTFNVANTGIPDFYHDTITVGTSKYVPFPPGPSILLLPFVSIWGTSFRQVYFVMALGAINAALFWYLLETLKVSRATKLLLVPFFAFGTVHFYSATTGTAWFYAHISAVFFLLLAIIFLLRRAPPFVPAIFLGFAFLSREPTIFAAPFFAYWLFRQRHDSLLQPLLSGQAFRDKQTLFRVGLFAAGLLPFIGFWFWYNAVRFGGPLDSGYNDLYRGYEAINIYSFYRVQFPNAAHFGLFDFRNIPLHLYTIFLMPPQFTPDWSVFRPSPYGLSVLLTSPAFVYAAFVKRNDVLKPACWLAIGFVSIPLLLYFSQGWVQFGYRFLLDFAPFLLILTAFGFDDNASPAARRLQIFLVGMSILAGLWGRYWGTQLGW
jgi:hypothetical protein